MRSESLGQEVKSTVTQPSIRLAVVAGGLTLSLTAAAVASADPNEDLVVNTTCSYPQVVAALNAQDPQAAQQAQALPQAQQYSRYSGTAVRVASTYNNY